MKRAHYNDASNFYEEEAFEDAHFGGFPARGGRAMNEPRNPAFRMIPNMKKIFVVKSSGVSNPSVRLIQKPPVAQRQRALGYAPGQLDGRRDWYSRAEHSIEDGEYQMRFAEPRNSPLPAENADAERSTPVSTHLIPLASDSADEKTIKTVLNNVVQQVAAELEPRKKTIKWEPHESSPSDGPSARRVCGFRTVEPELLGPIERLRHEIIKRRHRVEIECANGLGLVSPWRRTRYRKPVEEQKFPEVVNPNEFSLHSIGDSVEHNDPFDFGVSPYETIGRQPITNEHSLVQAVWNEEFIVPMDELEEKPVKTEPAKKKEKADANTSSAKRTKLDQVERCFECKKTFDSRRFSIQCADCRHRFHGKCVAMSDKKMKKLDSLWICRACDDARANVPTVDLFCTCKKPYNPAEFYVGCDGCGGWYHPKCVNTTQAAIEATEAAYLCPSCRARGDIKKRFKLR